MLGISGWKSRLCSLLFGLGIYLVASAIYSTRKFTHNFEIIHEGSYLTCNNNTLAMVERIFLFVNPTELRNLGKTPCTHWDKKQLFIQKLPRI